MGTRKFWGIAIVVALAALGLIWFFVSPTGTAAVEAIDHTADEITGKRAVDQSQQLKSEVMDIRAEQKERLRSIGLGAGAADH